VQEALALFGGGGGHKDALVGAVVSEGGFGAQVFERGFEERDVTYIGGRDDDCPALAYPDVEATRLVGAGDA